MRSRDERDLLSRWHGVRLTAAQERERRAVVARVQGLTGGTAPIESFAPAVLAAFAGVSAVVFEAVDNAIGNAAPELRQNGWMVRRVRNHPVHGEELFAGLRRGRA